LGLRSFLFQKLYWKNWKFSIPDLETQKTILKISYLRNLEKQLRQRIETPQRETNSTTINKWIKINTMAKRITQKDINDAVWKACDTFRGSIDPAIYKDYVLTMLFVNI